MKPILLMIDTVSEGVLGRVAIGAALGAIALGLQTLVWPRSPPAPFLLIYPAVVVAAWLGRTAAGLTAVVMAALVIPYRFVPPYDSYSIHSLRDMLDIATFVVVASGLVGLVARARRALIEARAAKDVAEQATVAKDMVLAMVAHDLRNPLQTIRLSAELAAASSACDEATRLRFERILRAATRARRLVDNIVDSAKLGATPLPLALSTASISDLLDETLVPFRSVAKARNIDLVPPSNEARKGTLVCDPDRIVQVLSNLVGNALQYTPSGGKVRVDVASTSNGVRFDVVDTGAGMTADELTHAFDRLWHGAGPGHGSGLGLWISKALVELHGGTIEAKSEPGRGTRMSFVVPQAEVGVVAMPHAPTLALSPT